MTRRRTLQHRRNPIMGNLLGAGLGAIAGAYVATVSLPPEGTGPDPIGDAMQRMTIGVLVGGVLGLVIGGDIL